MLNVPANAEISTASIVSLRAHGKLFFFASYLLLQLITILSFILGCRPTTTTKDDHYEPHWGQKMTDIVVHFFFVSFFPQLI